MRLDNLKCLDDRARAVFDALTRDLQVGGSRRVNGDEDTFMAVSVDRLTDHMYSVGHYYEKNGDLMADPDMTFFCDVSGAVYPCTFQQDNLGIYRVGLAVNDTGSVTHVHAREQREQTEFANRWMRNIAEQQPSLGLSVTARATEV